MAGAAASRGFRVIGIDLSPAVLECANAGVAPVTEPGLSDLYRLHADQISATADYESAVRQSDITFVYVNTPSLPSGAFSSRNVIAAAKSIGRALAQKDDYHLVVLVSTVIPGTTQTIFKDALERSSGKQCSRDFGLCFNPEFIALGTTIHNMLSPDFVVLGESDERAGDLLDEFYGAFCLNGPPIVRVSLAEAELVKVGINSYLTLKISFANLIAEMCEAIPGARTDRVTRTIGLDSRIGGKFLTGGLPYGGPCFPRDNGALAFLARSLDVDDAILNATDDFNRQIIDRTLARIRPLLAPGSAVGILGLAYKPGTDVITESPALDLAMALSREGYPIVAHDPLAMKNAARVLPQGTVFALSPRAVIEKTDVVVIANPCDEFRSLVREDFEDKTSPVTVLDCWRLLEQELADSEQVRYIALGTADGFDVQSMARKLTSIANETLQGGTTDAHLDRVA